MKIACKLSLILVSVLMLSRASAVSAHENYIWPYVTISCDSTKQVLIVSEAIAESEAEIPKSENAWGLDNMLQFIPSGPEDGVMEIKSPLKQSCKFGTITYRVVVLPYNYNPHVQGMCGAAAPSVKLTISRNGKVLIQDFVFRINCMEEGDTKMAVERISFSEVEQRAMFQLRNEILPTQKIVNFDELPRLRRDSLFQ